MHNHTASMLRCLDLQQLPTSEHETFFTRGQQMEALRQAVVTQVACTDWLQVSDTIQGTMYYCIAV